MRREPQQIRAQQRVKQILDAAEQMFGEIGYENTTTNKIAAAAGVPVGSIYQFFDSKDAILSAVTERYGGDLIARYRAISQTMPPMDAQKLTIHILTPMMDYGWEHVHFTKLILSDHAIPSLEQAMTTFREQLEAQYVEMLERAGVEEAASLAGSVALTTILAILSRVIVEKAAGNPERGDALCVHLAMLLTAYWKALGVK